MKRFIMRAAAFMMTVLLASAPFASAELKRGDRSEDVAELQQLLFESGWLFELPDGIFGRNTEEAVKGFEKYANLPVDGIADDQMIYELSVSLEALNEELGIVSDYFGDTPSMYIGSKYLGIDYSYGDIDYTYEEGSGMDYAACCIQSTEVDGSSRTDYCEQHHTLHAETYDMLESGNVESAQYASGMWYAEVSNLYDRWVELATEEEERAGILANRATFLATVEAQRMAGNFGTPSDEKKIKTEAGICQNLRNQAAWLCSMIWQAENIGTASGDNGEQKAIVLNDSVIFEGDQIYYAGSVAGEGKGIYVMNLDGSNRHMISDISATLEAVSNGNLLVWHYDYENSYGALEVLRNDGTRETVAYDYNGHAIAHNGRFYYGGSSVAEDGYDHQWVLKSDPEYHDCYWPLQVEDGYLYYLDSYSGVMAYSESSVLPVGVEMGRLNLMTGQIELVSGVGTRFIGIEDGSAYYTRESFYTYSADGEEFEVEVDDGLYHMNLEVLAETRLADISEDELVFYNYRILSDDVIYGERYDCRNDPNGEGSIIGVTAGGNMIQPVTLDEGKSMSGSYVENGVYFGTGWNGYESPDGYYSRDFIMSVDLNTGEIVENELPQDEAVNYGELIPKIAVIDGKIFYYICDWSDETYSLKVMNLDGSDVRTLVKSESLY